MSYKITIYELYEKKMKVYEKKMEIYNILNNHEVLSMIYNLKYELYKLSALYKSISDIMREYHVDEVDAQNIQNIVIDMNFLHIITKE